MCNKAFLAVISLICLSLLTVSAHANPDSSTKIIQSWTISLGSDFCEPLECNRFPLWFYLPANTEQSMTLNVRPACIAYAWQPSDYMNLTIRCLDGTAIDYDMKDASCDDSKELTFIVNLNSTGYTFFGERQYQEFWCSFIRDSNVIAIPTEFTVTIDGVNLHSKYIPNTTMTGLDVQSSMATTIESFASLNIQIWQIAYNVFVLASICAGIFFVIGAIPVALQWIAKKLVE